MGHAAVDDLVPVPPSAVSFPLEVPLPPGFDPARVETWPTFAGRFEYVDGKLLYMPPTGYEQQYTCADVTFALRAWAQQHPEFRVAGNEAGMLLDGSTRGADVAVWRATDPRPPEGGFQRVPPILAVEVAGKYDTSEGLTDKAGWYLDHGVSVVWLIFPISKEVAVITPAGTTRRTADDRLPEEPSLPGLAPEVRAFFLQI